MKRKYAIASNADSKIPCVCHLRMKEQQEKRNLYQGNFDDSPPAPQIPATPW